MKTKCMVCLASLVLAVLIPGVRASGQGATVVSVGAVTRDSGLYVGPKDIPDIKEVNKFLNSLESALAGEVSNQGTVQYLDRSSVGDIFRELHLSSGASFDPSSGAARGLLGRLDFLIVIDALDPSTAKMRLIDVETGAVRGVENCAKRFSIIGLSTQPPDCVPAMAKRVAVAGRQKAIEKAARISKLAQQQAEAAQAESEREKSAQQQQVAADARLRHQAAIATAEADKARLASEAANREAEAERVAASQAILELKPSWDDATSRLSAAREFWSGIQQQMAGNGQSLRPEIQSLLRSAGADATTGNKAVDKLDIQTLKSVTSDLNAKLSKLDSYK